MNQHNLIKFNLKLIVKIKPTSCKRLDPMQFYIAFAYAKKNTTQQHCVHKHKGDSPCLPLTWRNCLRVIQ